MQNRGDSGRAKTTLVDRKTTTILKKLSELLHVLHGKRVVGLPAGRGAFSVAAIAPALGSAEFLHFFYVKLLVDHVLVFADLVGADAGAVAVFAGFSG